MINRVLRKFFINPENVLLPTLKSEIRAVHELKYIGRWSSLTRQVNHKPTATTIETNGETSERSRWYERVVLSEYFSPFPMCDHDLTSGEDTTEGQGPNLCKRSCYPNEKNNEQM
jgi:hypothetical protein